MSYILIVLQGLVVVAIWLLHDFSSKKAGVQHHVQFKRAYYLHHFLTPGVRITLGLLAGLAFCFFVCKIYKKRRVDLIKILGCIWSAGLAASLLIPSMQEMMIYPYFVLGLGINSLFSLVGFGLVQTKE